MENEKYNPIRKYTKTTCRQADTDLSIIEDGFHAPKAEIPFSGQSHDK
jgi:hypothetical protein